MRITLETDELRFVGLYSSGIQRLRQREETCFRRNIPQRLQKLVTSALRLDPAAGLCGKAVIAEPVCTRNSGAYHAIRILTAAPDCILPHTVRVCTARHAKELRRSCTFRQRSR